MSLTFSRVQIRDALIVPQPLAHDLVAQPRAGLHAGDSTFVERTRPAEQRLALLMTSAACMVVSQVLYAFALRDVGWTGFCPADTAGGEFCDCDFPNSSEVLSAYCCEESTAAV